MTIFLAANVLFLNPSYDGNVYRYATSKELKKKAFRAKGEDIKQTIGIQLSFILEIKLQKYIF